MKFCKDCIYFKDSDWCGAPKNLRLDPVTGEMGYRWLASSNRDDWAITAFILRTCGENAKWFEPKGST